jgi:hypothetical protein
MRILLLIMAMLATAPAANAAAGAGRLEFAVTRNGEPFGAHTVLVTEANGELNVRNAVALRAGVGPLTVFRFEHECTERWRAGALQAMACETLEDGRRTAVSASRTPSGIRVTGPAGATNFPADALPTTWWTTSVLNRNRLIDAETGEAMPITVTRRGAETLTVGGQPVQTTRYLVQGTIAMDIWYDNQGRWVRAAFTARNQRIEYRLVSPLSAAPR